MRLRNIPGAKDAILECDWVIDEPERFKGKWESVFGEKRPLFLEVGMGKGRFLMDMARLHHAKRRLTSREFLKRYEQVLKKEGAVEFKTDNRGLFEFSLEEVKESDWNLEVCTFDLHHDEELVKGNVMTEYEEKFSSMGNPICKMVIRQK